LRSAQLTAVSLRAWLNPSFNAYVTYAGKSGTFRDIKTSKTGHVTITVVQANGERFKTLAKTIVVRTDGDG